MFGMKVGCAAGPASGFLKLNGGNPRLTCRSNKIVLGSPVMAGLAEVLPATREN